MVLCISGAACFQARMFSRAASVAWHRIRLDWNEIAMAQLKALLVSKSLGLTRASSGVVLTRRGTFALFLKRSAMKSNELKEALRLITKVLSDSSVRPDQGNHLQRAKRELEAVARSGKLDKQRIFRAVEIVAKVLLERVENDASRK